LVQGSGFRVEDNAQGSNPEPRTYSHLSATIGSTLVARRAGTKQASRATPVNDRNRNKGQPIRCPYAKQQACHQSDEATFRLSVVSCNQLPCHIAKHADYWKSWIWLLIVLSPWPLSGTSIPTSAKSLTEDAMVDWLKPAWVLWGISVLLVRSKRIAR